jgi:hypothetical protein
VTSRQRTARDVVSAIRLSFKDRGVTHAVSIACANPKHEVRNPKHIQNSNAGVSQTREPRRHFGIAVDWISGFFRISNFGFRISAQRITPASPPFPALSAWASHTHARTDSRG